MIETMDVCFTYAENNAGVHNVNLTVKAGECVCLLGASGSGKTTITRLVNGLAPAYYEGTFTGKISLAGKEAEHIPMWRRGQEVGSIFQDPQSQFFSGELNGEVAFGCENLGLPGEEVRQNTDAAISEMGLDALRGRALDRLSSGEKQRVAIASVRAMQPRIYVFDEPTANLDEAASRQLSHTMKVLKAAGHALLVAEHRISWLMDVADRFLYVQGGKITLQFTAEEIHRLPQARRLAMGIRCVQATGRPPMPAPVVRPGVMPLLAVQDIGFRVKKLEILSNVSMVAYPGQVVAIVGKNGIGKTTLGKIIAGITKEKAGMLKISGKPVPPRQRNRHVWFSSNDTTTQFFTESVSKEILLGQKATEAVLEEARGLLRRFGLYEYKGRHPATLSGGQRQRLSIACGLLSGRDILVLDEPTSGLDGKNLLLMAEALKYAAAQGKAILVITHDAELMGLCCSHCLRLGP